MEPRPCPVERCDFQTLFSNIAQVLFFAWLALAVGPGAAAAEAPYVGVVVSAAVTEVASAEAGRLTAVWVRPGEAVRRGQAVAKVEAPELPAALAGAGAALDIARSGVAQAETALRLASERLRRVSAAAEVFSALDRSSAVAAEETARSGLDAARARLAQAEAELGRLEARAAGTVLRSQVEGWVAARLLDPGALVAPGQALLRLKGADRYLLRFAVPPAEARTLAAGEAITWQPDGDTTAYPGKVARIAREIDLPSQMVFLEADLEPAGLPAGLLQDGLVVRVQRIGR